MSKLVIACDRPGKFGAGRRPARLAALWPDAERRDGPAGAGGREHAGRQRAVRGGDRDRPVRRRVHRARRRGSRRAGGRAAQRRHRRARRGLRYVDDARGRRDADARFCPRRLVQLSRDRGRHRRASRCSAASPSMRAPASAAPIRARCRPATNCRRRPRAARPSAGSNCPRCRTRPIRVRVGSAGRRIRRRRPKSCFSTANGRFRRPAIAWATGSKARSSSICTATTSSPTARSTAASRCPATAQPIVLMPDRGTSGGYPKIATVISADFGRFAQIPAGRAVPLQGRQHGRGAGGSAQIRRLAAHPARTGCEALENFDLNIEALRMLMSPATPSTRSMPDTWQIRSPVTSQGSIHEKRSNHHDNNRSQLRSRRKFWRRGKWAMTPP